ncbi:hypothetical protein ALC56_04284 [Trachymyrmex septentrionalis]|uniref:Uncharacterized protein n=1 Tax=Trachymyrmex septentrionalis TaxID=34720 RepID=A0A195FL42_9HYME|nr:hypothetical protein ALC56_04284 [Trachymyrmex septentrionalis]
MVLFVVHAGRWDTRDTCNDITTVTGMTVTAHNIGNEFVDEKFANRSDCTIRLLSSKTLQAETSGLLIIIISELTFVVRFCPLAVESSALETNKGDPAGARTRPSLKAI